MVESLETQALKNPISCREAAMLVDMSMAHLRTLARTGALKAEKFGPILQFERADVLAYAKEKAAGRKKGTIRGARPRGFSADVTPGQR